MRGVPERYALMIARCCIVTFCAILVCIVGAGCQNPNARVCNSGTAELAGLPVAVRNATEHHQTPYATPRLTDRWRARAELRAVVRRADNLLAECDRQRVAGLAAAGEARRSEIGELAVRVQRSLEQVKVAVENGDRPGLRKSCSEFACAYESLVGALEHARPE